MGSLNSLNLINLGVDQTMQIYGHFQAFSHQSWIVWVGVTQKPLKIHTQQQAFDVFFSRKEERSESPQPRENHGVSSLP